MLTAVLKTKAMISCFDVEEDYTEAYTVMDKSSSSQLL